MKSLLLLFFTTLSCVQAQNVLIKGNIVNYANQPLYLYQYYGDTLLLIDSTHTDKSEEFVFFFNHGNHTNQKNQDSDNVAGLYKIVLQRNQWFYILNDNKSLKFPTYRSVDIN